MSLVVKVLGAGQHIGKSCNLVSLNNVNILLDCGIQITKTGRDKFPDLESIVVPIPGLSPSINKSDNSYNTQTYITASDQSRQQQLELHSCSLAVSRGNISPSGSSSANSVACDGAVLQCSVQHQKSESCCWYPSSHYRWNIEAVLITHFHLDHIGALPYLTEVLGFHGPVYMTQPTLELARILLNDSWCKPLVRQCSNPIKNSNSSGGHTNNIVYSANNEHGAAYGTSFFQQSRQRQSPPPVSSVCCSSSNFNQYSSLEDHNHSRLQKERFFGDVRITANMIESCLSRVTTIPLNCPIQISNSQVYFTASSAGHVIGAVMFLIEDRSSGQSVLYTGDYTTGAETLFDPVKVLSVRPTVLITESTYGSQVRESKKLVEQELCRAAEDAIRREGNVLIPVGGVGKAQEIAALLNFHWKRYGITAPILLSSGMMDSGMGILRRLDFSWSRIRWDQLEFVSAADVQTVLTQYKSQPVVFLAPPKTLDAGMSFEVFKEWAADPRNLVLIPSYSLPGTLAYQIISGKRHFPISGDKALPTSKIGKEMIDLKAKFRSFSLASHSDSIAIQTFVKYTSPLMSLLVHGEAVGMKQLAANIRKVLRRPVVHPKNNETVIAQLPGLRIQPTSIMNIYYDHLRHMNEVEQNKSNTSKSITAGAPVYLRVLLRRSLRGVNEWLSQKDGKSAGDSSRLKSPTVDSISMKQENLANLEFENLVAEWAPDLIPRLDSLVMPEESVDDKSLMRIMETLKCEQPWNLCSLKNTPEAIMANKDNQNRKTMHNKKQRIEGSHTINSGLYENRKTNNKRNNATIRNLNNATIDPIYYQNQTISTFSVKDVVNPFSTESFFSISDDDDIRILEEGEVE